MLSIISVSVAIRGTAIKFQGNPLETFVSLPGAMLRKRKLRSHTWTYFWPGKFDTNALVASLDALPKLDPMVATELAECEYAETSALSYIKKMDRHTCKPLLAFKAPNIGFVSEITLFPGVLRKSTASN